MADLSGVLRAWLERMEPVVRALRGDVVLRLGDGDGANKLRILDAAGVEVASIDSNGGASFSTGTVGDMLKAVYDTDDDGKVESALHADAADTADTAGMATYASTAGVADTAGYAALAGTATSATSAEHADAADAVPWDGVLFKPSTFPPATHTHDDIIDSILTDEAGAVLVDDGGYVLTEG